MRKFKEYEGFLIDGRINIPEKIGAGIQIDPLPCLTVCFDWEYIQWSRVRSLHRSLLPGVLISKLGESDGPGFGFRNQNYYRVGAEYRLDERWTVRAGYRHAISPIRASQAAVNSLVDDLVEDFVTVGATWQYNYCNEISGFFAWGFQKSIRGENSIPFVPFGGGSVRLTEQKYAIGLSWGWRY